MKNDNLVKKSKDLDKIKFYYSFSANLNFRNQLGKL